MSKQNEPIVYPIRRKLALLAVFVVAGLMVMRAVDLQLTDHEILKDRGDATHLRVVEIQANRGMISDRRGEPLAITTPISSVWAVPGKLALQQRRWPELAILLGTNPEHLRTLIEPRINREFIYLKRHVTPSVAAKTMQLNIPGVALMQESRRYYPAGEVTAHIVGFTNVDDTGQEGIELSLDGQLRGRSGAKRVIKDRLGRVIENVESIRSARPGENVQLTIDKRVQYLAYRELKSAVRLHRAKAGSIVIIDVHTGEILAMVNQPSFNPNNRSGLKGEYYRNRAVTDVMEPGSTIKPFTIATALESGIFRPGSEIDTRPGVFAVGNHKIRDVNNYGVIDLANVIVKSSNVGTSKVALSMDPVALWQTFNKVGFGESTFGGLPGESAGRLPDYHNWREIEHATMAFGYGLSVTTLQLARAYAVLGNGGIALPTRIVRPGSRGEASHRGGSSANGTRVFSEQTTQQIRRMLTLVVRSGTGKRAAIPGYSVAGKTGTVHKASASGYAEDRYLSLFAGIAPAKQPRIAAVVMIDEPQGGEHFGGAVAAPIFASVIGDALRLLNVPPDALDSDVGMLAVAEQP
jgi:cell division protein FtsI (penicillin-binding protein 3)